MSRRFALALATAAMFLTPSAASAVFFQQPPDESAPRSLPSVGIIFQAADDFVLTEDASVTRVRWWGFYPGLGANLASPPESEQFTIRFFREDEAAAGNQPQIAFEQEFNLATGPVERALAGFDAMPNPGAAPVPVLRYEAALPEGVPLDAGVRYYLSIFNDLSTPQQIVEWSWLHSTSADGVWSRPGISGPPSFDPIDQQPWEELPPPPGGNVDSSLDLAFELIPEPASLALLAAAAGLTLRTRRRLAGL